MKTKNTSNSKIELGDLVYLDGTTTHDRFYAAEVIGKKGIVVNTSSYKAEDLSLTDDLIQVHFTEQDKVQLCFYVDLEIKKKKEAFKMKRKL